MLNDPKKRWKINYWFFLFLIKSFICVCGWAAIKRKGKNQILKSDEIWRLVRFWGFAKLILRVQVQVLASKIFDSGFESGPGSGFLKFPKIRVLGPTPKPGPVGFSSLEKMEKISKVWSMICDKISFSKCTE